MDGRRTVGRYRAIDLSLFALMLTVSETVMVSAATKWFPGEAYTVSAVGAVTAIVMMRWGPWSAIHAALGGAVTCFASKATGQQYAVYCCGNLLGLGALGLKKAMGAEDIRQDALKSMFFGLVTLLLMQLGRAGMALIFGAAATAAAGFFTTDVISLLFTLAVVWVARRLDGIFEDQRHYLLRLAEERERERGGFR